jgi:multidrug efflux system outer membrane protein
MERRAPRLFVACALAALLAGCRLAAPPKTAEVVGQALPKDTAIPPQWSSTSSTEPVEDDWLASFHDPGLDAVVAEAIAHNLDLREAAARVEAARENVVVVGSQLWPQIGANIGGHHTGFQSDGGASSTTANQEYLGIYWEMDVWGRLRAQRSAAQQEFEVSALDAAFARQSIAATTAKSW